MEFKLLLLSVILAASSYAAYGFKAPLTGFVRSPAVDCRQVYKTAGLSENFNETVAHAIHSMTVQSLRLFNQKVTVLNQIPTVNHDLKSAEKVISYAPEDPLGSDFNTFTMNTVDKILSLIGKDDDGLGSNWSPTERIVHKLHMWDVWSKVNQVFQEEVVPNPPSEDLCDCITDTKTNGIYAAVTWVADHYEKGTPITLLNRPIPKLTDYQSWTVWKERLLWYYKEPALRDAAVYLWCATKDF